MQLPLELIYYILLFDRRFVMRESKLITINKLILSNYEELLNKPLIVPNIVNELVYGYIVHFHSPLFKIKYSKFLDMDNNEMVHRLMFEKNMAKSSYMVVYVL